MKNLILIFALCLTGSIYGMTGPYFGYCIDPNGWIVANRFVQTGAESGTLNVKLEVPQLGQLENVKMYCGINKEPSQRVLLACSGVSDVSNAFVSFRFHKGVASIMAGTILIRKHSEPPANLNDVIPMRCF